jgi:hypothetical protein
VTSPNTTETTALVISDPYPATYDWRSDKVYTVIEIEDVEDGPHRAMVQARGVRKGSRVRVIFHWPNTQNAFYTIVEVLPPNSPQ